MNVVDLHPEDLIDKLESGSLSTEEKARLETHLRGCAECRFEISVRADLADEALAPRARPAAAGPLAAPEAAPRPIAPRRSLPPRRALLFPAIAAALVAGGALAAVVSEVVRVQPEHPSLHRLESPLPGSGRHKGEKAVRAEVTTAAVGAGSEEAAVSPPAVAERPLAPEEASSAVANRPSVASVAQVHTRTAASPSAPRTSKAVESAPAEAEPRTAAALFGAANRARRYGDTAQAVSLYRSLQGRFPASEEARLSRATLATLELDRGDPEAALDGFDRYLEQGGSALSVEALVGRAVALQKLGKSSEELASWREVARRFPGTAHAKRAAARIAALSGR